MEKKLEKIYSCIFNILDESGGISVRKKIKDKKEIQTTGDSQTLKIITVDKDRFEINLINFNGIEGKFSDIKYPFLNYIIDDIAKNMTIDIDFYEKYSKGNPEEVNENCTELLSELFKNYLDKNIMSNLSGPEVKLSKRWLERLNDISLLKYEGRNISGRIVFCDISAQESLIDYKLKFKEKVSLKNSRQIRKMLEMTTENFFLIGDYEYVYGIGWFSNLEKISLEKIFAVDFEENRHYMLYELHSQAFEKNVDFKTHTQIIEYRIKTKLIVNIKNTVPKSYESRYNKSNLEAIFNNILKKLEKKIGEEERNEQIKKIKEIVEIAKDEKKGTMLVFMPEKEAKQEIKKLKQSAIVLEAPIDVIECMDKITSIDGAILFDYDSKCYGVGVILDGISQEELGDPSRGARYNSAIKYIEKENLIDKCVIIVISEDGMIDILPKLNKSKLKEALNFIKSAIEIENRNKKTAKNYYQRALVIFKEIGVKKDEALMYKKIARLIENIDKSEELYKKALVIYKEIGERKNEAITYSDMAALNVDKEKAIKLYKEALVIFIEEEEKWWEAITNSEIARLTENKEESKKLYEKALGIFEDLGEIREKAIIYIDIAKFTEDREESKKLYESALEIFKEIKGEEWWEAISYNGVGRLTEDRKESKKLYESALEIFKEIKDEKYINITQNLLRNLSKKNKI